LLDANDPAASGVIGSEARLRGRNFCCREIAL